MNAAKEIAPSASIRRRSRSSRSTEWSFARARITAQMPEPKPLPTADRLLELVRSMAGQPVLVLADMVADRFITGPPKRISREGPVLIPHYQGETLTPGGGANAVANIAALGGTPLP